MLQEARPCRLALRHRELSSFRGAALLKLRITQDEVERQVLRARQSSMVSIRPPVPNYFERRGGYSRHFS